MVRFGNLNDLNDVLEMLEECKRDMRERNLNIWNDTYPTVDIIKNDLTDNHSIVFDLNGKVVAFLAIYPKKEDKNESIYRDHSNYCLVQRVMSHPSYRRQGHAEAILHKVEEMGFSSIRLLTRNTNIYSVNLYMKLGYEVVGEIEKDNCLMRNCEKLLKA